VAVGPAAAPAGGQVAEEAEERVLDQLDLRLRDRSVDFAGDSFAPVPPREPAAGPRLDLLGGGGLLRRFFPRDDPAVLRGAAGGELREGRSLRGSHARGV